MPASTIPLTHMTPDSSQIHGYGYRAEDKMLAVEFKSNQHKMTYHYPNTTPEEVQAIHDAPSKGAHIGKHFSRSGRDFQYMPKPPPETADSEGGDAA